VNLMYSPIKNVDLGGELIFGKRKTFDGESGRTVQVRLDGALQLLTRR